MSVSKCACIMSLQVCIRVFVCAHVVGGGGGGGGDKKQNSRDMGQEGGGGPALVSLVSLLASAILLSAS